PPWSVEEQPARLGRAPPHGRRAGLWPAGRSHVAVGVTWAVRWHGIEVESPTVRIRTIVGIGQSIVRVRHRRARRDLVDTGTRRDLDARMRRLAMRAGRPFVFGRRERRST